MSIINSLGKKMLKKFTPLVILILFAIALYLMIQGMNNAINITDHKKVKAKKEAQILKSSDNP